MSGIPSHPFIIEELPTLVSGVDFLGLAAVNERLAGEFLPGINNFTRYMRVYSAMSWMAWRFDEHFKHEEGSRLSAREISTRFSAFRQKVELLFTWGNLGRGSGLVGATRTFPAKGTQKLAFSEFGSSTASWLDAPQYGPSLKVENGLGFLQSAVGSSLRPTQAGTKLALALDAILRASPYYRALADVSDLDATPQMAKDLGERWSIASSSKAEKQVFRDNFAPANVDDQSPLGMRTRCSVVRLIWAALRACGGSGSTQTVREALSRGIDRGKDFPADAADSKVLCTWTALQVRQLQRICHEAFLRWLELSLLNFRNNDVGRTTAQLARHCASLALEHLDVPRDFSVSQLILAVRSKLGRHASPLIAGRTVEAIDPFAHMRKLLELGSTEEDAQRLPSLAVYGLAIAVVQAEELQKDELYARPFALGSRDRICVSALIELFASYGNRSLGEFTEMLLESCTVSQHFATAAARLEIGKNKYRFLPSEGGLKPLIDSPQGLIRTPDRIETAMHLMADCGLLRRISESEYGLPPGKT